MMGQITDPAVQVQDIDRNKLDKYLIYKFSSDFSLPKSLMKISNKD